jgi:Uma2 family endonuclease
MATITTAPITLEEFERLPDDGNKHELSEGILITMPPPVSLHSLVLTQVLEVLQAYLRQNPVGRAMPEAGYFLFRYPPTVRQPDISVLSKERIQATPKDSWFEGAPEIAVEVVSPSDSAQDLEIKTKQYLQAGAKQVWVLYPATRTVHVSRPNTPVVVLDEIQTLTGGDLLPGFSVKVADLFV